MNSKTILALVYKLFWFLSAGSIGIFNLFVQIFFRFLFFQKMVWKKKRTNEIQPTAEQTKFSRRFI
jgi:hypothetical protein